MARPKNKPVKTSKRNMKPKGKQIAGSRVSRRNPNAKRGRT